MLFVRCLDRDGIASIALAHGRRHIRCTFPSDQVSPVLVAGENMGQRERGDDQDVQSRSARKTPRRATPFIRLHLPYNGTPPPASSEGPQKHRGQVHGDGLTVVGYLSRACLLLQGVRQPRGTRTAPVD